MTNLFGILDNYNNILLLLQPEVEISYCYMAGYGTHKKTQCSDKSVHYATVRANYLKNIIYISGTVNNMTSLITKQHLSIS